VAAFCKYYTKQVNKLSRQMLSLGCLTVVYVLTINWKWLWWW